MRSFLYPVEALFKAFDTELFVHKTMVRDSHALFLSILQAVFIEKRDLRDALQQACLYHGVQVSHPQASKILSVIETVVKEIQAHAGEKEVSSILWHGSVNGLETLSIDLKEALVLPFSESLLDYIEKQRLQVRVPENLLMKLYVNLYNSLWVPEGTMASDPSKWYGIEPGVIETLARLLRENALNHLREVAPKTYARYASYAHPGHSSLRRQIGIELDVMR